MELTRRNFLGAVGATGATAGLAVLMGSANPATAAPAPAPTPGELDGLITRTADGWALENDAIRVVLQTTGGGMRLVSVVNTANGHDYVESAGGRELFRYRVDDVHDLSADSGWNVDGGAVQDVVMHTPDGPVGIGRELRIVLGRTAPVPFTVTVVLEIYAGPTGIHFTTNVRNDSPSSTATITESVVLALPFADVAHTLHFPRNARWESTRGPLGVVPDVQPGANDRAKKLATRAKKVVSVLDTGEGWSVSPELTYMSQRGKGERGRGSFLPPYASLDVWDSTDHLEVVTNPESLQLVLFPGEEFEYLSVNLTVFVGDLVDAKMAEQEHFRRRFRFNNVTALFNSNDWDYRGGSGRTLPPNFYHDVIIPKVERAGIDMVMLDDYWNSTRDTIEPGPQVAAAIGDSLDSLTTSLRDRGLLFGLWFSLTGGATNEGRDIADPANLDVKRAQIVELIEKHGLIHQMVDLTEFWQTDATTTYSHPSDSAYRKSVLSRRLLNELVERYPDFRVKYTSEVDVYPHDVDRNNGLAHIVNNGWVTQNGGVTGATQSIITAITHFGHLPMEAMYFNAGKMTGKMEDYYALMMARNVKFPEDPSNDAKWPEPAVELMGVFNRWRKSPRVRALTEELWRPVHLGHGWDTDTWLPSMGPFAWMHVTPEKDRALLVATGHEGHRSSLTAPLRWLDPAARYAVADVTIDDDGGMRTHAFRGVFKGARLRDQGIVVDLSENTSRGKAFWLERVEGSALACVYVSEEVSDTQVDATNQRIKVAVSGAPSTVASAVVVDPVGDRGTVVQIPINANGRGSVTVQAAHLRAPKATPTHFADPYLYDAEQLTPVLEPASRTWRRVDESAANGGSWILAELTSVGDAVSFDVHVEAAGRYRLDVRFKENTSRGRSRLSIDGEPVGPELNHYYPSGMYRGVEFRERPIAVVDLTAGTHTFRFESTGTSGSSHQIGVDYIKLTPSARSQWVSFEAEAVVSGSSVPTRVISDAPASPTPEGRWLSLDAGSQDGAWVDLTIDVAAPGRYRVTSNAKKHVSRGRAQLVHDGKNVGEPFDQFLARGDGDYQFASHEHGVIEVAEAGATTLRFVVAGKADRSESFALSLDSVWLTPEPAITAPERLQLARWQAKLVAVTIEGLEPEVSDAGHLFWEIVEQSANEVVWVDQTGRVTGVAPGEATVRVRHQLDRSISVSVTVTVV